MSVNGICLKRRSCYLEQAEACPATSGLRDGTKSAVSTNQKRTPEPNMGSRARQEKTQTTWVPVTPKDIYKPAKNFFSLNLLTAEWALRALIDFTLSNARRFYSSIERFSIAFTANGKRQAEISSLPKTRVIYSVSVYILPVSHSYGASTKNREIS